MSRSIDERAVIMEFDNDQFEKGIAQSRKSLEEFEKKLQLEGASKAINNINKQFKNIDFSLIQNSLESIADRFSGFGIVGMTVIQNLTNAVVDFTKGALTNLYNKINEAGKRRAINIEQSHFLLQGILKDEEQVQDAMKRADDSVTGTAYAYDAATKAAATFVASGARGEELSKYLNVVADLTATVSGNYEDISDIIQKIVGAHKLYKNEMDQITHRGFTLDEYIADYFTAVNNGLDNVPEKVKENMKALDFLGKGIITRNDLYENNKLVTLWSETVMAAIDHTIGGTAQRANETFTGAIENIGAAWARIGALFWSPLVAQNSELIKFINALRVNINAVKEGLRPFAESITNIILKISEGAKAIGIFKTNEKGIEAASGSALHLTELFEAMFKIVKPLFDVFEAWLPIQSRIFGGPLIDRLNRIIDAFSTWVEDGTGAYKVTSNLRYKLDLLAQSLNKALKPLKDFWDMVRYAFYTVFDLGDTTDGIEGFVDTLTDLFKRIDAAYDRWDFRNSIANSFITIFETLKTVGESVWKIITAIGEAFADVFIVDSVNDPKDFFEWFADILKKLSKYITIDDEAFNSLKETFKNIFTVGKEVFKIFGQILSVVIEFLPNLMPFITKLLEATSGVIGWAAENINAKEAGEMLAAVLEFLKGVVENVVENVQNAITEFNNWLGPIKDAVEQSGILESINELLATSFEKIKEAIEGLPEKIQEFCDTVGINTPSFEDFVSFLNSAKDGIDGLKTSIQNFKIGEGFSNFISGLFGGKEESNKIGGAASIGLGQRMKLQIDNVGAIKKSIDDAGGNKTFESVKDTILKFLIPLLNAAPKLAIAIMGLVALKTALDILKEVRRFKEPLADVRDAWASVGKSFSNFIDKSALTAFIATIALLVGAVATLLVIINQITKSGNATQTFVAFGIIMALLTGLIVAMSLTINRITHELHGAKSDGLKEVYKVMLSIAVIFAAISVVMLAIGKAMILMATAMNIAGGPLNFIVIAVALAAYMVLLYAIMQLLTKDPQERIKGGKGGKASNPSLQPEKNKEAMKRYLGIAAILAGCAVAFVAIGKAMLLMASAMAIEPSVWWKSLIFFAAFGGFVIGLMFLANKTNGVDYKALLGIAAVVGAVSVVMIAFAASIDMIIVAIAKIAGLAAMGADLKTSFYLFIGIAGVMIAAIAILALIMTAMSEVTKGNFDYKTIIAVSVGMVAFATAIDILMIAFAPLVAILSSPAATAAWASLGMLAAMMGVMVVAIGVLTAIASWAPGGTVAMIVVSAAMITFATSMLILAEAMRVSVGTLSEFLLLLDAFGDSEGVEKFSNGIKNFFDGLATGFKEALPSIQSFLAQLFTGDIIGMIFDYLIQAFESKISKIADSFGRIVDKIHEVLLEKSDKILEIRDMLYSILFGNDDSSSGFAGGGGMFSGYMGGLEKDTNKTKGLLGGLAEFLKRIFVDTLPGLIVGFFTNIGKLLVDNGDSIKSFWIGAIEGLRDILVAFFKMIGDVIMASADSIITPFYYILGALIAGASNFLVEHHEDILTILGAPFTWLGELLMRHHQDIVDFMIAPFAWITDAVIQGHDTIMAGLGAITATALEWLGILFHELKGWWEKHWEPDVQPFLYQSFMDTLALALKALEDSTVSITATAVALGLDIIAGIIGGLANGIPQIVDQTMRLVDTIRDTVVTEENINHIMKSGEDIIVNFLNGMSEFLEDDDNTDRLREAFDRAWESVIHAIRRFFKMDDSGATQDGSILHQVMHDVIIGLAKGIFIGAGPLIDAVDWLCGQMMGQMTNKDNFDVNSPSKWSEKVGVFLDEGLSNGLKKGSGQVLDTVDELSSDTKSAFSTMMEALKIAGNTEFDIDPTITPVVDISNIEDAAAFANGAFSGIKGGFAFTTNRASALAASIAQNGNGTATVSDGTETATGGVVNFTQNNYSPKSLSHYEIYRQTKNLLHTIDSRK